MRYNCSEKINEISKNNLHEIDRFIKFSYQGQVKKLNNIVKINGQLSIIE